MASEKLIQMEDVFKTYFPYPPLMRILLRSSIREPIQALKKVTFDVEAGQICAVIGPNGAGKSTLFRILTGLTTPTGGVAKVCGFDSTKQSFNVRRIIGFHAADDRMLLGRHSCDENLAFHGRLQGMPAKALRSRIKEVLQLVGLEHASNRLANALSSGMKARLQLARAILHRPRVLILDEPTGALDPVAAYNFLEVIKSTVTELGIATLISSHRVEEIEALPGHILLLDAGNVVFNGNLESLRRHWETPGIEIGFPSPASAAASASYLASLRGVEVVSINNEFVQLRSVIPPAQLFAAANGYLDQAASINEVKMPLRDLLAKVLLAKEKGVTPAP